MNNEIGQQIKVLREAHGISVVNLVDGVMTEQQYYRIIRGEHEISTAALQVILDRMGYSVDALLENMQLKNSYAGDNVVMESLLTRKYWTHKDGNYFLHHFEEFEYEMVLKIFKNYASVHRNSLAFKTGYWNIIVDMLNRVFVYAVEKNSEELITEILNMKSSFNLGAAYSKHEQLKQLLIHHEALQKNERTLVEEIAWAENMIKYAKYVDVDEMIHNATRYFAALKKTTLYQ